MSTEDDSEPAASAPAGVQQELRAGPGPILVDRFRGSVPRLPRLPGSVPVSGIPNTEALSHAGDGSNNRPDQGHLRRQRARPRSRWEDRPWDLAGPLAGP